MDTENTTASQQIKINDFNLFYDIVKALSRMSDGVKFTVNDCGLTVYAKNDYSKCEMTSNSITTSGEISFCIGSLNMFLKVLTTVKDMYKDTDRYYSGVRMFYEKPFIKIESKKFKTKLITVDENRVINFIGTKVHTTLTDMVTFTTSSNHIKTVNSHSYIFNDSSVARIYLSSDKDMQNNTMFARIGDDNNDLSNSITLELGMINSGVMDSRKIILDFNRLNILNMIPSDEIKVSIAAEKPVLMSSVRKTGLNDTYFNNTVYVFMMVK